MSKEYLEALEILCGELVEMDLLFTDRNGENQNKWLKSEAFAKLKEFDKKYGSPVTVLQNALHRLESIDNSNPSEALERLEECAYAMKDLPMSNWCDLANSEAELDEKIFTWVEEIKFELFKGKQALLKAQEHNSLNLLMQELDCKDFAELRKYARCGHERLNSNKFKGSKVVKIEIPEGSLMDYNPTKQYLKWEDLEFNHTPKMIDVKMNGNKYKLVVGYNVAGKNLAILRDNKKEYYFLECDKQFFNDLHLERVEE